MLQTNFKIAICNPFRNKSFSFINRAGHIIGLTTLLAIILYVINKFSYDQFHVKKDRIYNAKISAEFDGQTTKWGGSYLIWANRHDRNY